MCATPKSEVEPNIHYQLNTLTLILLLLPNCPALFLNPLLIPNLKLQPTYVLTIRSAAIPESKLMEKN